MSLNSKKICFSLVLAAAAGMVQAVNSSCLLADAGFVAVQDNTVSAGNYTSNRPKEKQRLFRSTAVEKEIVRVQMLLKNRKLSWMFANCFPNTLDTTVFYESEPEDDTFVVTGDIPAMWLRDSSAQVWPYLMYANEDERLRKMIRGVILRQVRLVLLDPIANPFYRDLS